MSSPKLSVLIAAYNAEKYLDECIQSILVQKYEDYEVIIVNDGSTDSTYDICLKYAAMCDKIKVVSWENHGLILSRRKALSESTGEYVLFLDADDAYKDNAFEEISSDLSGDEDVIIYRFEFLYENGTRKESDNLPIKYYSDADRCQLFEDFISNYEYNHMWSKVMRRDLLVSDPYDYNALKSIKLGEDLLQSINVYGNAKKVVTSNRVVYSYRVLSSSMSHGFNSNHITDIATVYRYLAEYINKACWNTDSRCNRVMVEAFSIKISGILRELWMSNETNSEKIRISEIIERTNADMVNPDYMVFQNKILWKLIKIKRWKICNLYISGLKIIKKLR